MTDLNSEQLNGKYKIVTLKCDVCGKFISYSDLDSGKARRYLVTPDGHFTREEWVTTCKDHTKPNGQQGGNVYLVEY